MKFTDIFISKPVLASVVSLFIFLLGLRAATELNVRQYPELENAVVTVTTVYTGADADLIQGFITTPLEQEIASADGIDYLVSTSLQSASSIQAYIRLGEDPNEALTQIVAKVNKMRSELPEEAEDPTIETGGGPEHRLHVPIVFLGDSRQQPDHRLSGARGAAQAGHGQRRAAGADSR